MIDPSLEPMLPPRPIGEFPEEAVTETRRADDTTQEPTGEAARTVDLALEPMLPRHPIGESPAAPMVNRPYVDIGLEALVPRRPAVDSSLEALNAESEDTPEEAAEGTGGLAAFALLLCLAALHVLANLWWLHEDNHTIPTDEEGHMHFAREFHEVLFVQDFPDPVRRLIAASHIRPGIPAHPLARLTTGPR